MGKLHLKETPEERERRKAEKAHRKSRKRTAHLTFEGFYDKPKNKRRRQASSEDGDHDWASSQGQGHSSQAYLKEIEVELEERRFREKLHDAMVDDYDNRLDNIEAQFNEYAHIPHRWQSAGRANDVDSNDLNLMDDEEYAEWIREGMWRYVRFLQSLFPAPYNINVGEHIRLKWKNVIVGQLKQRLERTVKERHARRLNNWKERQKPDEKQNVK